MHALHELNLSRLSSCPNSQSHHIPTKQSISIASSSSTHQPTSKRRHLKIRSGISTNTLEANTRLSHRRRTTTSINRTSVSRAIPSRTMKIIGTGRKATADCVLSTESAIASRCEAIAGRVAAAGCDAAAGLSLALCVDANAVLAKSRAADIAANPAVLRVRGCVCCAVGTDGYCWGCRGRGVGKVGEGMYGCGRNSNSGHVCSESGSGDSCELSLVSQVLNSIQCVLTGMGAVTVTGVTPRQEQALAWLQHSNICLLHTLELLHIPVAWRV